MAASSFTTVGGGGGGGGGGGAVLVASSCFAVAVVSVVVDSVGVVATSGILREVGFDDGTDDFGRVDDITASVS